MPIETNTKISKLSKVCTSDGSGNFNEKFGAMNGIIDRITIVPGTSGDQPDASFDVTITDETGTDILKGGGANISNTVNTNVYPAMPVDSVLTVAGSGMGATNKMTVYLYRR